LDLTDGITLETVEKLSTEVHCIVNVKPSGIYTMADFDEAGRVPAVMKVLEGRLHLGCRTVTGATVEENLRKARVRRPEVIRSVASRCFAAAWPSCGEAWPARPWCAPPSFPNR
jgi:dihydroxyacid dehydratase/phosphogluconate dehydratase